MRTDVRAFFDCADNEIIEFALMRARLNKLEREVITLMIDDCLTQEEAAEVLNFSVRKTQDIWYKATDKLMSIPWVRAYALELMKGES